MKMIHLSIATAAVALLGGAAFAQQPSQPLPGSETTDKVESPIGALPSVASEPTVSASSTTTTAPAATTAGADVSATAPATFTNLTVTNGPVADTPENRAKYGQPMSRAGKRTAPRGN